MVNPELIEDIGSDESDRTDGPVESARPHQTLSNGGGRTSDPKSMIWHPVVKPGDDYKLFIMFFSPFWIISLLGIILHLSLEGRHYDWLNLTYFTLLPTGLTLWVLAYAPFCIIDQISISNTGLHVRYYIGKKKGFQWTDFEALYYLECEDGRISLKLGFKNYIVFDIPLDIRTRIIKKWEDATGKKAMTFAESWEKDRTDRKEAHLKKGPKAVSE